MKYEALNNHPFWAKTEMRMPWNSSECSFEFCEHSREFWHGHNGRVYVTQIMNSNVSFHDEDSMKEEHNIIIREATPADAEGIAFVHVNSWKTSYAGLVDQDYLDAISYENRLVLRMEILQLKAMLHLVAVSGEEIFGFADVRPIRVESHIGLQSHEKKIGEVYAIYLLEEHKGKGCGKALFDRCRKWLSKNRLESFVVRALAGNVRARRFYEREGGRIIGETTINIGDKHYQEVSYLFKTH